MSTMNWKVIAIGAVVAAGYAAYLAIGVFNSLQHTITRGGF